jgi:hypothetical protein
MSSSVPMKEILRVYLPVGTNQKLDALAAREHTDRSEWVRRHLVMPAIKADAPVVSEKAA